eukprot:5316812-Pleurochrysis_carterae.AAC.4
MMKHEMRCSLTCRIALPHLAASPCPSADSTAGEQRCTSLLLRVPAELSRPQALLYQALSACAIGITHINESFLRHFFCSFRVSLACSCILKDIESPSLSVGKQFSRPAVFASKSTHKGFPMLVIQ